ncbi:MAG: Ig-like domain-containing protein [Thermoplasmatota archaeon]
MIIGSSGSLRVLAMAFLLGGVLLSFGPFSDDGREVAAQAAIGRLVFAEDITATWCQYCPAASEGLLELSGKRDDFRFITLVDDRVEDANERRLEYKPSGFPTVMFDGGYEEHVGAVSSGDDYNEDIDSCLAREVPDINVEVKAYDLGGSSISVEATVVNSDTGTYSGILKVHIVEVVSRYLDYDGNNYPHSLLGYAFNGDISVPGGDEGSYSATWTGADVEDMLGNTFGDIDPDNIVVYAAVFNAKDNYKPRATLPPSFFIANYCDAAAEAYLEEAGNAPVVEITSPRDGRTVSGVVEISASVTSENPIDTVQVRTGQDSWREMELAGSDHSYSWDTTQTRNGIVTISVRATDELSLSGIDSIEVTVENEGAPTPPEISSLLHTPMFPEEGEAVTIRLEVTLYDTYVSSAEIIICIDDLCLPPKEMFEESEDAFTYETGPFESGQVISYHAVVEDTEGNIIESQEVSFTVSEKEEPAPTDDDVDDEAMDDDDGGDDSPSTFLMALALAALAVLAVSVRKRD